MHQEAVEAGKKMKSKTPQSRQEDEMETEVINMNRSSILNIKQQILKKPLKFCGNLSNTMTIATVQISIWISQGITESQSQQLRLKGTVWFNPCLSKDTRSWVLRGPLTISKKETLQVLGNLSQCFITCTVKIFLKFKQNLLCSSLCPLSLSLAPCTTENCMAPSTLFPPPRYLLQTSVSSPRTSSFIG